MPDFKLHPRLQQDCLHIADLPLCRLLMMNDSNYPWFILVPRRTDINEIHQLPESDRLQLLTESCALAETMQTLYQPDKLNIAAIGNIVQQLHVHHVARFASDLTWPAPVWGKLPAEPYPSAQATAEILRMKQALADFSNH